MSRGYEGWDDQPDARESGRSGARGGRRSRRSAAPEDSWPHDSRQGRGSGERSGPQGGAGSSWPPGGYDQAAYTDPGGYADSRGYQDSGGYGNQGGYPGSGGYDGSDSYQGFDSDAGRYESGGHSRRALPAGSGGYDSYQDNGYSGNGYADSGYQGAGGRSYGDGGYGDQGYGDPGYRDASYPGAGYAANGYPGGERDPYASPDPYRTDPGGGRPGGEPDYGVSDGYGAPGGYGRHDSYGGEDPYGADDQYGAPAGYRTSDAYPALEAYGESGAGRGATGYDAAAGYEHGGGYDDHGYGSAAGAREPGGRGAQDDGYGWQGSVDDSGISRRRGRASEDEIDADSPRHNGFFRGFGGGDDDYGHRPPKRRRSRAPMVALTVVIIFLAAAAGGGVYAYKWYSKRHADWVGSTGTGSVTVQVKSGEFACSASLENRMVSLGVVASATAFCDAAKTASNSASLEVGYFRLHKHMGAALAWKLLVNPKSRVQQTVTVPDGIRNSKIIELLAKGTGIKLSQFQAALNNPSALGLPSWARGNAEGFLYPDTYDIQPGATALSILQMMVTQFNKEASGLNLAAKAKAAQFTEYEVIIEASLLEGEVGPQYYTDVARVIDNRLNQVPPMDLGLDSTVAYATGKYIYDLSQSDLNVNSPYNTTKHAGLPPGPIDSPDAAAIEAVLHPAPKTNTWLYFVTVDKSGKTDFTSSYSQFLAWSSLAKKNLG